MIIISVKNKSICVDFKYTENFSSIVDCLKFNKCRFDPSGKHWIIPISKYDNIVEQLEDLDAIEISDKTEKAIEQLLSPESELTISPQRILFDQSLLRYPPMKGKPGPNENFQKTDMTRAFNRNRYALFLEMGTGKSFMLAATIAHLRKHGLANKVLFITSNIGAANMVHEMKKFIVGITDDDIICMTKAGKDRDLFKMDKNIAITNYNTFKYICDYYYEQANKKKPGKTYRKPCAPIEKWLDGKPGILILDESHTIGNNSSQLTNRIMIHKDLFEYRYLATGTPADKPEKLYTQLKILDNAMVDGLDYTSWLDKYAVLGTRFSAYAIRTWRFDKIENLNKRIQLNHAIFRKTEDCLDLPPNRLKKMYVQLQPSHLEIYKAFVIRTLEDVQQRTGRLLTRDIVNAFPFMQMALDNPKLLLNHDDLLTGKLATMVEKFKWDDSQKCYATDSIVSEHCDDFDQQGIIWVHHPDTAKALAERYKKYNPLVVVGEVSTADRDRILEQFKADKTHKLLIASIQVLNTSVTLVNCKFQVYFERVYNYSQYIQSTKRIHRIGQEDVTYTYLLIFDSTIDVVLDKNLSDKDVLNEKLLSKDFLSKDEWKTIFEAEEDIESRINF